MCVVLGARAGFTPMESTAKLYRMPKPSFFFFLFCLFCPVLLLLFFVPLDIPG